MHVVRKRPGRSQGSDNENDGPPQSPRSPLAKRAQEPKAPMPPMQPAPARKPAEAQTKGGLFQRLKHIFDQLESCSPIWVHDKITRFLLVDCGEWVISNSPNADRAISFIVLYMGMQALGMLYGFLINVFATLSIKVAEFLSGRVEIGSWVEFSATAYVVYATLRVLVLFGSFVWAMSRDSMREFPNQRKMVLLDRNTRWVMAGLIFAIFLLTLLVGAAPRLCKLDPMDGICNSPYLYYLNGDDSRTARGLRLALIVVTFQWLQFLLYEIPDFHAALQWQPWRMVMASLDFCLTGCTGLYFVIWLLDAAGFDATTEEIVRYMSNGHMSDHRAFGTLLMLAWQLWYLTFTLTATWNPKSITPEQDRLLVRLMKRMKWTVVSVTAVQFVHSCLHVRRGYPVAMEEQLYISMLAPTLYSALYGVSLMVMKSSTEQLLLVIPVSAVLAYLACTASGVAGSFTYVLVFINFWELCVRSFGVRGLLQFALLVPEEDDHFARRNTSIGSESDISLPKSTDNLSLSATPVPSAAGASTFAQRSRMSITGQWHMAVSQAALQVAQVVMKVFLGLMVVFIVVMIALGTVSYFQDQPMTVPSVIQATEHNDRIHINHLSLIDLELYKHTPEAAEKRQATAMPLYSVCGRKWHGLTIVDYALLAEVAYFDPEVHDIQALVNMLFPASHGPAFTVIAPEKNMSRHGHAEFFEVYSPELDLSVIAIRGTDPARAGDMVEDAKMFSESIIYTLLSFVFPTIRMWPDSLLAFMVEVYAESLTLVGLSSDKWYYDQLVRYLKSLETNHPQRNVVVTGHSLGGALARITGFLTGRASITFSSPGIGHSYRKVRAQSTETNGRRTGAIERRSIHHKTINIWPELDPFAAVDMQAGLLQRIQCLEESKSLMLACHMLESTICELLRRCGDERQRFAGCEFKYQISNLVVDLWPYIRPIVAPVLVLIALTAAFTLV